MAYIGQSPSIGNFQVCDAISTVNGQATYNLTVNSVAVTPETANHVLCSVNGILQKPGSSFSIVNSTIVFSANLVTGDVVDFVHILGSVLDLGVPSDDTVSTAKISANAVTGAKLNTDVISAQTALATEPADTDEFLVSDAGVLKRIDYSLIKGGGGLVLLSHTTISSSTANAAFTSGIDSTYDAYKFVLSGVRPVTDDVDFHVLFSVDGGSSYLGGGYKYAVTAKDSGGNTEDANSDSASFIILTADDVGNESDESFNAEMVLYDPSNTAFHKQIAFQGVYYDHGSLPNRLLGIGANSGSVAAVNGIKFQFASGNIAEGSFTMYGIAKA